MKTLYRKSPVQFDSPAIETEIRDGWPVVLKYAEQGEGPHLVDLSHRSRWDLQDGDFGRFRSKELEIPHQPGQCTLKNKVLISRMNRTQASVWHLGGMAPAMPDDPAFTDVMEASAHLTLFGPRTFSITEKLTSLDLLDPAKQTPFLLQGPLARVSCQIVVFRHSGKDEGCVLFTCARGYGQSMVQAVLSAGAEYGLRPAGETDFVPWLQS